MSPFYVVTDCEFDGPIPGANSMLSFGSVAVSATGSILGEFEAVLGPLEGAVRDANTMAFWHRHPDAWAASTENPELLRMLLDVSWIGFVHSEASRFSQHIRSRSMHHGSTTTLSAL
jgi:hypothetical protein